jgi:hypothetical protein
VGRRLATPRHAPAATPAISVWREPLESPVFDGTFAFWLLGVELVRLRDPEGTRR